MNGISKQKRKRNLTKFLSKLTMKQEHDELGWLDHFTDSAGQFYQVHHANSDWSVVELECKGYSRNKWKIAGSTEGRKTFIVRGAILDSFTGVNHLPELFDLVEKHKINRLIFTKCVFEYPSVTNLSITVKEMIFNQCTNPMAIFSTILDPVNCKKYNVNSITLRRSKNLEEELRLLQICLSHGHHIRKLRLIKCKYSNNIITNNLCEKDFIDKPESNEQEKKLKIMIHNNKFGYEKCEKVCLIFLSNKMRKLTILIGNLDRQVINNIVKIIWKSRYQEIWYV